MLNLLEDRALILLIDTLQTELRDRYPDHDSLVQLRKDTDRMQTIRIIRAMRRMGLKEAKEEVIFLEEYENLINA